MMLAASDSPYLVFQLIAITVCGGIACAIAASKGRTPVGWFFVGFLAGIIGIIIICCMPNLKEEKARWAAAEQERHRLREQIRQERFKTEALRQHSMARLDAHDKVLGVDTRSVAALPGGSPPRLLPLEGQGAGVFDDIPPVQTGLAPGELPPWPGQTAALAPSGDGSPGMSSPPPWPREPAQAPPPARVGTETWYYAHEGQTKGPVSAELIMYLLQTLQIRKDALVWCEELVDWTSADQVEPFRSVVQQ